MHHINTAEAANETRGRLQLVGGSETETDLSWQSAPNTLHDTRIRVSMEDSWRRTGSVLLGSAAGRLRKRQKREYHERNMTVFLQSCGCTCSPGEALCLHQVSTQGE
ncbi:hypothetical protein EYF80_042852 [Liparis tanakae]|uniref:Uncharacterized protein n=1 Tax=Liparis tanakae TaxID=230148 RepID=A0A4Z2G034_9TELE|nr:hypothetical protein EYF80_042852 [Liparis tanakae]